MSDWQLPQVWPRLRRQSAVLVLMVVVPGAIALLWGGARLQHIFIEERVGARQAVEARRRAIEKYARVALERKLRTALTEARPRIDAALDNPLQAEPGLFAVDDEEQRLPRLLRFADGDGAPARALYQRLADGAPSGDDGILGERIALLGELRRATGRGDDARTTRAVRDFLNHQSRYVIAVTEDLPLTTCFVETLVQRSTPARSLMQALLRDGLRGTRGRKLVALQASLLDHRERFTRADFTFLAEKLSKLSRATRVVHDDFEAKLFNGPTEPVPLPDHLDSPALIAKGAWFVAPLERGSFRGVSVDLNGLLEDIAVEMRAGGLLGAEDGLATAGELAPMTAVADLPLDVKSRSFATELAAIEQRYALKTAIGVALGALVILVAVLGALLFWRQRRYLEGKASFVATVSHELRTPLASLRLMGETLERRLEGIESAKDFPSRIVGEVDRLTFLVENILSYNRLERPVSTNRQAVTVGELVDTCRMDIAAFTKKPVRLSVAAGADATLNVDTALAKLLISNLVHNACKYNDSDSVEITVEAVADAKQTVVRLSDNGTGIATDDWGRVFTEFVRAKNSGNAGGFGLGLALCRRILRLHDGTIRVADSSDAGTTFEMVFPNPSET